MEPGGAGRGRGGAERCRRCGRGTYLGAHRRSPTALSLAEPVPFRKPLPTPSPRAPHGRFLTAWQVLYLKLLFDASFKTFYTEAFVRHYATLLDYLLSTVRPRRPCLKPC